MGFAQAGLYAAVVMLGSGCGEGTVPDELDAARSDTSATSLPCDETEQTAVALDVPGPGRPSPEEAVAPFAGALTLVAQERGGGTTVLGLRADGTVFRVFEVTEREDGWWPDGYRECFGSR